MPLAEHIATDGLYSQHVNPQWEKLLKYLTSPSAMNAAREPSYSQRTADAFSIFFPGIAFTMSATIIPTYWGPSSMNCKSVAPVMLQSHVSELAGELAERLCKRAGGRLSKVFFASSGSEGIEAAIKFSRAHTGRTGLLYADRAFHGLTCGALSLMDGSTGAMDLARSFRETDAVPFGDVEALEQKLATRRYAAFFVEPVQSEGGIRIPDDRLPIQPCRRYAGIMDLSLFWTKCRPGCIALAHFLRRTTMVSIPILSSWLRL